MSMSMSMSSIVFAVVFGAGFLAAIDLCSVGRSAPPTYLLFRRYRR